METSDAIKIINALANGVDPNTGDIFEEGSPYHHPSVIRALFLAIQALERVEKKDKRASSPPAKAGSPWSTEEDKRLLAAFDQGIRIIEIAKQHSRTRGAITARLLRLGRTP